MVVVKDKKKNEDVVSSKPVAFQPGKTVTRTKNERGAIETSVSKTPGAGVSTAPNAMDILNQARASRGLPDLSSEEVANLIRQRQAQGADTSSLQANYDEMMAKQEQEKQQKVNELVGQGASQPKAPEGQIVTSSGLLADPRQGDFYVGALNQLTEFTGTEGAGQAVRNAFGVALTDKQLKMIQELNPDQGEEYVRRIQQVAIEKKNRSLGKKIAEGLGGVAESIPGVNFVLGYTNIQTPSKQIGTIKDQVSQYESAGDKLGIAGKADPIGTIQNINDNIEQLDALEAELQYLVLESSKYQASGEAQAIAKKMDTVRSNLINKRDEISARYLMGTQTPTTLELQETLDELNKALKQ